MHLHSLFSTKKPLIACIHLMPLPGSPLYDGNMAAIYQKALEEVEIFKQYGVDGLIIENFRDKPFYPNQIPAETIAAIAGIGREIVKNVSIPVGINALRNDAVSALAIANAIEAQFIRVNVHMNAIVSEQGIIEGKSHETLRLRSNLRSNVLIFADVGVKHAAPLAPRGLAIETKDLCNRGLVDGLIVSGELTGVETDPQDLNIVKQNTSIPVLIGSGVTPENIEKVYKTADGFIVGSYFKIDGLGNNFIDPKRVERLITKIRFLSQKEEYA